MRTLEGGHKIYETEAEVVSACESALLLAPESYPPTLPSSKALKGAPEWYPFEHTAWPIGESIRLSFVNRPRFRARDSILKKVVEVACCRNLRRGRQSFIMALAFKAAARHAPELAAMLSDRDVDGQVVDTLLKMKAAGFAEQVRPLEASNKAWIRKLAKRYLERYPKPGNVKHAVEQTTAPQEGPASKALRL